MTRAKSQSALEYLMIIAITLGILVPTSYLFFRYSSESTVKIVYSQISQIGRSIIDTAEIVYFSGEAAKMILEVNMPKEVEDIDIIARMELVFKVTSQIGATESVFFSSSGVPIISDDPSAGCTTNGNCDLSGIAGSGLKKVKIEAINDGGIIRVRISKFQG